MGGKSNDFGDAAIQQGEVNEGVVRDQTYANRPIQYTPWGYTSWSADPYTDPGSGEQVTRWSQTTGLTPELQDILDKQIAIQGGRTDLAGLLTGRMGQEFGQAMDYSGLSPWRGAPVEQFTVPEGDIGSPYETRQRAEDAMYSQAMSRLQPQFEGNRRNLEIKMRNQGLGPQDAAWQSQMQSLQNQENDALNQATWSAVQQGRAESGQMYDQLMGRNQNMFNQALGANAQNFNQAFSNTNLANQIRAGQMAEMMGMRGQSLNEIMALLSGQQVGMPSFSGFQPAQAAQAAPIYQGAADQASVNAALDPTNALLGAAGTGLGVWAGLKK